MKDEMHEIFKKVKTVSLRDTERSRVKNEIISYAEAHPVQKIEPEKLSVSIWSRFVFVREHVTVMAVVALLFVGGGASAFAEFSLPGDLFYPVKTGVNEEVRSWFAFSTEGKGMWELERAERRLGELEALSEEREISPEIQTEAEARFAVHAERAGRLLALLQEEVQSDVEDVSTYEMPSNKDVVAEVGSGEEEAPVAMMMATLAESEPQGDAIQPTELSSAARISVPTETPEEQLEKIQKDIRQIKVENKAHVQNKQFFARKSTLEILYLERSFIRAKIALRSGDMTLFEKALRECVSRIEKIRTLWTSADQTQRDVATSTTPIAGDGALEEGSSSLQSATASVEVETDSEETLAPLQASEESQPARESSRVEIETEVNISVDSLVR